MKKLVLGIVVLMCLNISGIFAQAGNNEQRLVGSWTNLNNNRASVINADGTTSGFNIAGGGFLGNAFEPTHWAAAGNRIVFFIPGSTSAVREFHISSDGRTLIIVNHVQFNITSTARAIEGWSNRETGSAFRRN